jgi:solute carrier family 13 (sodium-dependent dicarboxylate transporter), member 2/3/5
MVITALLSMFVSNTATTATMFAVVLPILVALPAGPARTGLALSIPIAANVGGIGTPVGSPPTPSPSARCRRRGGGVVRRVDGARRAAVVVVLLFAWWFLTRRYVPADTPMELDLSAEFDRSPAAAPSTSSPAPPIAAVADRTAARHLRRRRSGSSRSSRCSRPR